MLSLSRSLKIVALGCALLLAGCDRQSGDKAQPQASPAGAAQVGKIDRSRKGSEMPDFQLTDPAGKALRFASLKGKPVLINLWATWCAPCVAELPQLNQLAIDNPAIRVLTVNQDMDKLEKVPAFLVQKGGAKLEPWLNPDNSLTFQFGAETLPATVYYDANGREVWRIVGPREWLDAETKDLLAEAK